MTNLKFVEILTDFKKSKGGKSPEKIDKFKEKLEQMDIKGKSLIEIAKSF